MTTQAPTLEEARAILAAGDSADSVMALEAIAVVLRFNAISDPKLLAIAEIIETVARDPR
jgi:hypothetical protein